MEAGRHKRQCFPAQGADAGKRFKELRLAVASDASHAQNLAFSQNEGNPVDTYDASIVAHHNVVRLERDRARMRRALVDLQDHLAPDHGVGEFRGRRIGGVERRDHLAAPHHRHAVRQIHDFAQLVSDEDDGLVLALEHAQHLKQLIRFRRREHRRRLVEHQDLGAAHQRLENLNPLLQAYRQFADDGVGIHHEAIFMPEFGESLADRAGAFGEQRPTLGAEHHVFEHGERRHQHEVLMHHADAMADGLARGTDSDRLAVDTDFACVGFIEAVENRHQRRFTSPILTHDSVDDSAFDDQVDIIVGVDRAEALINADELDGGGRLGGHVRLPDRRAPLVGRSSQATIERQNRCRWPGQARPRRVTNKGFSRRVLTYIGHLLSDM